MVNNNEFDLRFKVNLQGIIELLSNHLYSSPKVYIRELLQNAVDAVTARRKNDSGFYGSISIELFEPSEKNPGTLVVEDNGIGLTEEEVHQFLAVIGQSSKREEFFQRRNDFIGQFGIGLLSCFIVCDEIIVITKSEKSPYAVEWVGKYDGTYRVRKLDNDVSVGTKIYLRCRPGSEEYFQAPTLKDLFIHYGCFLPYPIYFSDGKSKILINNEKPFDFSRDGILKGDREAILEYGKKVFDEDFIDYIPLFSKTGDVSGIAYIISYKMNPSSKRRHRVYLKNMFLSDSVENLLPDWAFFLKCVVNCNDLEPTASREQLCDDKKLSQVQAELGDCIRSYLVEKARFDTFRLREIIKIHTLAIKALSLEFDELYKLFIDWLPFETSLGILTFGEIKKRTDIIQYTPSIDEFRQIQKISAAKSICILNCGYIYDTEIIEKLPEIFHDIRIERISPTNMSASFEELDFEEREKAFEFIKTAEVVLQPFNCSVQIKKFEPTDIPALFMIDEEANLIRNIENTKEVSNFLFSSILGQISDNISTSSKAQLCFNYNNPLITRLIGTDSKELVCMSVEIIYIQSLLMGHYPLNPREMKLLNSSLLNLIDYKL